MAESAGIGIPGVLQRTGHDSEYYPRLGMFRGFVLTLQEIACEMMCLIGNWR